MSDLKTKKTLGWHFPAHEQHLPVWMSDPKNFLHLNARQAYQGKKQRACYDLCRQLGRSGRNSVAVDVGAHVGLWSYNMAFVFEQVHAFEPMALHRECFAQNVLGFVHVLADVILHGVALGAEPGLVGMVTEQGSSGNTHVGAGHPDHNVEVRTLDSYVFERVDFIKIDCEGYEENVLRGGVETLKRCRPIVCVEQKRDMAERFGLAQKGAVDFLLGLGYRQHVEMGGDHIMVPA